MWRTGHISLISSEKVLTAVWSDGDIYSTHFLRQPVILASCSYHCCFNIWTLKISLLDISLHMWLVMIIFGISFECIFSETDPYWTKHIQKTGNNVTCFAEYGGF